jgi:cystathionine gamma-lyase
MRDATKIIRSTLSHAVPGEPLSTGPVFAAPYHTPGDPSDSPYTYARSHNPTWTALEKAIGQMESGQVASGASYTATALVFASGMAACAAVFGAVLRPGDVVVLPSNAYYTARILLQEHFAPMGITLRMSPTAGNAQAKLLKGARLLWIESPSNPGMEICDIALLSEAAHRTGTLVAVDNTTPTPLGQLPLALGADFSVASDSKAMTGHSDLLIGHVAMRDPKLHAKIDQWRTLTGAALGPMEAWLALRSIATLPLRLERACENAQRIAEFLTTRKEITSVLYPGLPSHPGHEVAKKQMRYFGPVLSFVLRDKVAAETFLSKSTLLTDATSFGGVTTTAERRAKWGGDAVPDGFIRMSAGCEAIEDLIEDMAQALDAIR